MATPPPATPRTPGRVRAPATPAPNPVQVAASTRAVQTAAQATRNFQYQLYRPAVPMPAGPRPAPLQPATLTSYAWAVSPSIGGVDDGQLAKLFEESATSTPRDVPSYRVGHANVGPPDRDALLEHMQFVYDGWRGAVLDSRDTTVLEAAANSFATIERHNDMINTEPLVDWTMFRLTEALYIRSGGNQPDQSVYDNKEFQLPVSLFMQSSAGMSGALHNQDFIRQVFALDEHVATEVMPGMFASFRRNVDDVVSWLLNNATTGFPEVVLGGLTRRGFQQNQEYLRAAYNTTCRMLRVFDPLRSNFDPVKPHLQPMLDAADADIKPMSPIEIRNHPTWNSLPGFLLGVVELTRRQTDTTEFRNALQRFERIMGLDNAGAQALLRQFTGGAAAVDDLSNIVGAQVDAACSADAAAACAVTALVRVSEGLLEWLRTGSIPAAEHLMRQMVDPMVYSSHIGSRNNSDSYGQSYFDVARSIMNAGVYLKFLKASGVCGDIEAVNDVYDTMKVSTENAIAQFNAGAMTRRMATQLNTELFDWMQTLNRYVAAHTLACVVHCAAESGLVMVPYVDADKPANAMDILQRVRTDVRQEFVHRSNGGYGTLHSRAVYFPCVHMLTHPFVGKSAYMDATTEYPTAPTMLCWPRWFQALVNTPKLFHAHERLVPLLQGVPLSVVVGRALYSVTLTGALNALAIGSTIKPDPVWQDLYNKKLAIAQRMCKLEKESRHEAANTPINGGLLKDAVEFVHNAMTGFMPDTTARIPDIEDNLYVPANRHLLFGLQLVSRLLSSQTSAQDTGAVWRVLDYIQCDNPDNMLSIILPADLQPAPWAELMSVHAVSRLAAPPAGGAAAQYVPLLQAAQELGQVGRLGQQKYVFNIRVPLADGQAASPYQRAMTAALVRGEAVRREFDGARREESSVNEDTIKYLTIAWTVFCTGHICSTAFIGTLRTIIQNLPQVKAMLAKMSLSEPTVEHPVIALSAHGLLGAAVAFLNGWLLNKNNRPGRGANERAVAEGASYLSAKTALAQYGLLSAEADGQQTTLLNRFIADTNLCLGQLGICAATTTMFEDDVFSVDRAAGNGGRADGGGRPVAPADKFHAMIENMPAAIQSNADHHIGCDTRAVLHVIARSAENGIGRQSDRGLKQIRFWVRQYTQFVAALRRNPMHLDTINDVERNAIRAHYALAYLQHMCSSSRANAVGLFTDMLDICMSLRNVGEVNMHIPSTLNALKRLVVLRQEIRAQDLIVFLGLVGLLPAVMLNRWCTVRDVKYMRELIDQPYSSGPDMTLLTATILQTPDVAAAEFDTAAPFGLPVAVESAAGLDGLERADRNNLRRHMPCQNLETYLNFWYLSMSVDAARILEHMLSTDATSLATDEMARNVGRKIDARPSAEVVSRELLALGVPHVPLL